jgi:hypothetical protein
MNNIRTTLEERGNRYGDYKDVAKVSQSIKNELSVHNWGKLEHYQKESLEMIANKLARIVCGDTTYDDNWIDICGYSQLVVDELSKAKESK